MTAENHPSRRNFLKIGAIGAAIAAGAEAASTQKVQARNLRDTLSNSQTSQDFYPDVSIDSALPAILTAVGGGGGVAAGIAIELQERQTNPVVIARNSFMLGIIGAVLAGGLGYTIESQVKNSRV